MAELERFQEAVRDLLRVIGIQERGHGRRSYVQLPGFDDALDKLAAMLPEVSEGVGPTQSDRAPSDAAQSGAADFATNRVGEFDD